MDHYIIVDQDNEPFVNCTMQLLNGDVCGQNAQTVIQDELEHKFGVCEAHLQLLKKNGKIYQR